MTHPLPRRFWPDIRLGWRGRRHAYRALFEFTAAKVARSHGGHVTIQADYASRAALERNEPRAYEVIQTDTGDLLATIKIGRFGRLKLVLP